MFNEKLKYYRKRSLLTQEDLANELNVSRQIITKWESGIVLPSLEYLIDLSNLFGITIDTLVKDDDCITLDIKDIDIYELRAFLVKAKKETYAAKKGKIQSSREASHDYMYQEGKYKYIDSYVGNSQFSGQEIVYENNEPIWSMNYYGRVIKENFDGDFLKEALLQVTIYMPYRGVENYIKGDYCYHNKVDGCLECFFGYEDIFYQNQKIYELFYHGGMLK